MVTDDVKRSGWLACAEPVSVARIIPIDGGTYGCASCVTASFVDRCRDGKAVLTSWSVGPSGDDPAGFRVTKTSSGEHPTSVTDFQFVDCWNFVTGDSRGQVRAVKFGDLGDGQLGFRVSATWKHRHSHAGKEGARVTGVSVNTLAGDGSFASVGEDGRMFYCRLSSPGSEPETVRRSYFSTPLTCVTHSASTQVVAGTGAGSLYVWDLRDSDAKPVNVLLKETEEVISVMSVDANPSMRHLVAGGMEDGTILFWDLRRAPSPVSMFRAHRGAVTGVKFHPARTQELLSCSLDGNVIHHVGGHDPRRTPMFRRVGPTGVGSGGGQCVWLGDDDTIRKNDGDTGLAADIQRRVSSADVSPVGAGRRAFTSVDVRRDVLVASCEDSRAYAVQISQRSGF